jgi:hypothetical protein
VDHDASAGAVAVGRLVSAHAEEFAGSYVDESGVVVVVFAPAADAAAWRPRLTRAAGGHPLRMVRGTVSATELVRVQAGLRNFDWPSGRPAYGSFVDAARCAVVVQAESLPATDKRAVEWSFGALVVVDEGYRPGRR